MSDLPLAGAPGPASRWRRALGRCVALVLRVSLRVSPRPMALLIRRQFAAGGARLAATAAARAPEGVEAILDEPYDDHPDARLDVYRPARSGLQDAPLPVVVWIHGGAWVGGSKEELGPYLRLLASRGLVAVSVGYTRAPEATYPTPVRQALAALAHLQREARRLGLDPERVLLAGDSAGAQIASQVACIVSDPVYAELVGLKATIPSRSLRGAVLCCGAYDLSLTSRGSPFASFLTCVLWSYAGTRRYADDPALAPASTVRQVTAAFPPAFVTAGNADPLLAHSTALVAALEAAGAQVETLLFPRDHDPPLGHEYQFDLELAEGRDALDRIAAFCLRRGAG